MRRVILESPFAGNVEDNTRYARACVVDCLRRGEAPLASHLLYTQPGVLCDQTPAERALGIEAGLAWMRFADAVVFYMDLGSSRGMDSAVSLASVMGLEVEHRNLAEDLWARWRGGEFA